MSDAARLVLVGRFGAPHGVHGEVRLKSFTGDPTAILGYAPLVDAAGARAFRLAGGRAAGSDMLVVRVEGVGSREAAAALTGLDLYLSRDRLPAPEEDEFYHDDLVGLLAEDAAGGVRGRVVALHDFGAGDVLEIAPAGGGATLMLPFTRAAVPVIDLAKGRIVVDGALLDSAGDATADDAGRASP